VKKKLSVLFLAVLAIASVICGTPAMAATSGNYSDALAISAPPASETPKLAAAAGQSGSGHSVALTFAASTSAASCSSTTSPPCTFGYNVFRGTVSGAESTTPLNSSPITSTTYTDSTVTLGSSPITYFYVVKAVETAGGVTVASGPSNEASATFPGIPAAPASLGATPQ
jgi:hypothetical protein